MKWKSQAAKFIGLGVTAILWGLLGDRDKAADPAVTALALAVQALLLEYLSAQRKAKASGDDSHLRVVIWLDRTFKAALGGGVFATLVITAWAILLPSHFLTLDLDPNDQAIWAIRGTAIWTLGAVLVLGTICIGLYIRWQDCLRGEKKALGNVLNLNNDRFYGNMRKLSLQRHFTQDRAELKKRLYGEYQADYMQRVHNMLEETLRFVQISPSARAASIFGTAPVYSAWIKVPIAVDPNLQCNSTLEETRNIKEFKTCFGTTSDGPVHGSEYDRVLGDTVRQFDGPQVMAAIVDHATSANTPVAKRWKEMAPRLDNPEFRGKVEELRRQLNEELDDYLAGDPNSELRKKIQRCCSLTSVCFSLECALHTRDLLASPYADADALMRIPEPRRFRSGITVLISNGRIKLGVLQVLATHPDVFADADLERMIYMAQLLGVVVEFGFHYGFLPEVPYGAFPQRENLTLRTAELVPGDFRTMLALDPPPPQGDALSSR